MEMKSKQTRTANNESFPLISSSSPQTRQITWLLLFSLTGFQAGISAGDFRHSLTCTGSRLAPGYDCSHCSLSLATEALEMESGWRKSLVFSLTDMSSPARFLTELPAKTTWNRQLSDCSPISFIAQQERVPKSWMVISHEKQREKRDDVTRQCKRRKSVSQLELLFKVQLCVNEFQLKELYWNSVDCMHSVWLSWSYL